MYWISYKMFLVKFSISFKDLSAILIGIQSVQQISDAYILGLSEVHGHVCLLWLCLKST